MSTVESKTESDDLGFEHVKADTSEGFEIRVHGEVVHTVDLPPAQVEKIHVTGPTGAVTTIGSAFNAGFINLEFEFREYNNLEVRDEIIRNEWRELSEKQEVPTARPSGKLVGEEQAEEDAKAGEPEEEVKPATKAAASKASTKES